LPAATAPAARFHPHPGLPPQGGRRGLKGAGAGGGRVSHFQFLPPGRGEVRRGVEPCGPAEAGARGGPLERPHDTPTLERGSEGAAATAPAARLHPTLALLLPGGRGLPAVSAPAARFHPHPGLPPKGEGGRGRGGVEAEPRGPVGTGAWGEASTPNPAPPRARRRVQALPGCASTTLPR
jgi:hypothetical protein